MSVESMLLLGGALLGGFVQGLSGFAFSMVALSIWVWRLDPALAAVMSVFGALTGQLTALWLGERRFYSTTLAPYLAGGLMGVPLGIAALPALNPHMFKLVIGLFLTLCCPLMLCARQLPQIHRGGRVADALAGLVGGVMGGLGGSIGAIPVLWCTLRGLGKDEQRAVIQNFNLSMLIVTMLGYVVTGVVTVDMLPLLPAVAVAVSLPAVLGMRVYARLSQANFRQLTLVLLTGSGVAMLSAALPACV